MELIRELEDRFQNLDAKQNSNRYLFYRNFNNNYYRINTRVFSEYKEKKYENGLNQCRQEMLDQLIQKRNEQLQQVNEFMQSSQQINLSELKSMHKSLKQSYFVFAKGWTSVYESILFRSKLANQFQLAQLVKYSALMRTEEKVSCAKVNHFLDLRFVDTYVLPSNLLLLYCSRTKNMVVLNKSGDLIHFKGLLKNFEKYDVQVNDTNILTYNRDDRIVEIYSFKLEHVHSIGLEKRFRYFELNNYEIALFNRANGEEFIITCYNYKTTNSKKKEICINTNELKRILGLGMEQINCFLLVGFTDQYIFIEGYDSSVAHKIMCDPGTSAYHIFLMNRHDNNNLFRHFTSNLGWLIFNKQIGCITLESDEEFLEIYEIGSSVNNENILTHAKKSTTKSIFPTNYKHVFPKRFDPYNLILKFDLF